MNTNARDAVIAVCITAAAITGVALTGSLQALWLLVLLAFLL